MGKYWWKIKFDDKPRQPMFKPYVMMKIDKKYMDSEGLKRKKRMRMNQAMTDRLKRFEEKVAHDLSKTMPAAELYVRAKLCQKLAEQCLAMLEERKPGIDEHMRPVSEKMLEKVTLNEG